MYIIKKGLEHANYMFEKNKEIAENMAIHFTLDKNAPAFVIFCEEVPYYSHLKELFQGNIPQKKFSYETGLLKIQGGYRK